MRLRVGDKIALFNGADGEWEAEVSEMKSKSAILVLLRQIKKQDANGNLVLAFSPLRAGKSEVIVEKATELGVGALIPVVTKHTVAKNINHERLVRIAIEAAEQCERNTVPKVLPEISLENFIKGLSSDDLLIYCDETGGGDNARKVFLGLKTKHERVIILIGAEGGFSEQEIVTLRSLKNAKAVGLGKRILKADTAAFAVLSVYQSCTDDWDEKPAFRGIDKA